MTVGRFARPQALALRLIARNGERSTLVRKTDGAPADPAEPWKPGPPSFVETVVDAVWLDYDVRRIDGNLVKSGDQRVLIPGTSLESAPDPTTDHLVRVSGEKWEVVGVDPLQPNEDRVLYEVQVRQ